jgi:hypothetical protein
MGWENAVSTHLTMKESALYRKSIHALIPATRKWRSEACGSRPACAKSLRPYLKNKLKTKGLGVWLKWCALA